MQKITQVLKNSLNNLINKIIQEKPKVIGVSGIPGAGKSLISTYIQQQFQNSIIIPMDGYHLYKKDLTQEGIIKRGAPFTFNLNKFKEEILRIKDHQIQYPLTFPNFNHSDQDPKENMIKLNSDQNLIIIEGLYIFDKSLGIDQFWDMKIWIQVDLNKSIDRLIKRHLESGIVTTVEQAKQRALGSDKINGQYVKENSNLSNCFCIDNNF